MSETKYNVEFIETLADGVIVTTINDLPGSKVNMFLASLVADGHSTVTRKAFTTEQEVKDLPRQEVPPKTASEVEDPGLPPFATPDE